MCNIHYKGLIALCSLIESNCFVSLSFLPATSRPNIRYTSLLAYNGNNTQTIEPLRPKKNISKIYKINFSHNYDEEDLYEPKHSLGMSDFDIILLRICINIYIVVYLYTIISIKLKL